MSTFPSSAGSGSISRSEFLSSIPRLLLASLATLVGDAQLATRRRFRDQSDRHLADLIALLDEYGDLA
jgi:hypothetical protein